MGVPNWISDRNGNLVVAVPPLDLENSCWWERAVANNRAARDFWTVIGDSITGNFGVGANTRACNLGTTGVSTACVFRGGSGGNAAVNSCISVGGLSTAVAVVTP